MPTLETATCRGSPPSSEQVEIPRHAGLHIHIRKFMQRGNVTKTFMKCCKFLLEKCKFLICAGEMPAPSARGIIKWHRHHNAWIFHTLTSIRVIGPAGKKWTSVCVIQLSSAPRPDSGNSPVQHASPRKTVPFADSCEVIEKAKTTPTRTQPSSSSTVPAPSARVIISTVRRCKPPREFSFAP